MIPAVIGAGMMAGSAISGILGANAKKEAADRQFDLAKENVQGFSNIQLPTIDEQLLKLKQLQSSGELTYEEEQLIQQQVSKLESYKANPEAYTAQMQALQKYTQMSNEGLTATDKANVDQILSTVNNENASNQATIGQNYAQRGMSGSGTEAATRLLAGQSAAQTASNQGFQTAALNQQTKMNALERQGKLAQDIENQRFGQAQAKAAAGDVIGQFNTKLAADINQRNVAGRNMTAAATLADKQRLEAANTDIANREQIANKSLPQSNFQNEITRQGGISNATTGQANAINAQGAANAGLWSGLAEAGSKVGSALMDYDINKKKTT